MSLLGKESKERQILVTGGSGFLGSHLVLKLLNKYKQAKIKILSRDENYIQKVMLSTQSKRLTPIVGDIQNYGTVKHSLSEVDSVIHLAAMKHVGLCELYPSEAVGINIIGTINLLKLFTGDTFIAMSSDKAVEACSCYGATKLLLEKLVLEKARASKQQRFMLIRSGNIFNSTGSVIDVWKQEIKQSNTITVTNPEMTRFFINVNTLTDFILERMEKGENERIYIPSQRALKLADLAEAIIKFYGNGDTKINIIGTKPGEKMHEKLLLPGEQNVISYAEKTSSEEAEQLTPEEINEWLISDA